MINILRINFFICFFLFNSGFLIADVAIVSEDTSINLDETNINKEDDLSKEFKEYDPGEAKKASIYIIEKTALGQRLRSAIAVGNNYILSSGVSSSGKFSVFLNNKEYPANYISSDKSGFLLLFRVPNAKFINIPFALNQVENGRSLYIHHFNDEGSINNSRGSFQKKYKIEDREGSVSAFSHNLDDFLYKESAGAPILNNCGEIVGINVKNKAKNNDLRSNFIAIDHVTITSFLKTQDINFNQSLIKCLSESEKRIVIANEIKENELKAKNAEKEKEESEELRIKAEKEKEVAENSKNKIEEERAIQDAFNKNLIYAGSLSGLVLLILIFLLVRNNRKRKTDLLNAEKTIAAREALHIDPGPNFVLRGSDLTIKIPGDKLGLDQGVILGRNTSEADVILDRSEISRTHLRFFMREDKIYADDLGSANGTILNGARLSAGRPMALHNDDEITLAGIIFIVEGL